VNQRITKAIVLSRTDFGEADRIITVLTPDSGKLRLMAKGVRKIKSKLAGGIELFSVSDLTYIVGRGEVGTLVSSRLDKHFGDIVKDIIRVQLGYELIKLLNRTTEDHTDSIYFDLLEQAFGGLNDVSISPELTRCWFRAQLLKHAGHSPNLSTDVEGDRLDSEKMYNFALDEMTFATYNRGNFKPNDIKLLRLLFSDNSLEALNKVEQINDVLGKNSQLIDLIFKDHIGRHFRLTA
jgi:DNA repair protein RecO